MPRLVRFPSDVGIGPSRVLFDSISKYNSDSIPSSSGIPPVRLLLSRHSSSSSWSLGSERGIGPENPLYDRLRYLNLGIISGSELGICPEKELADKSSHLILRPVQLRTNHGNVPLRSLLARDKNSKLGIGENFPYSGLVKWLFPRLSQAIPGS